MYQALPLPAGYPHYSAPASSASVNSCARSTVETAIEICTRDLATFPTAFRLSGLHFPGTPLAHRPSHDIVKLAITRPGLADAGSAAATPSLELHTEDS